MRLRIHVRVDSNRKWGSPAHLPGDPVEQLQLFRALHIVKKDAGSKGKGNFVRRLAYPGEDHLGGVASSPEDPVELSSGDDVEASAELGEQLQHRQVGVRLDRVGHQAVLVGEALGHDPKLLLQRSA